MNRKIAQENSCKNQNEMKEILKTLKNNLYYKKLLTKKV